MVKFEIKLTMSKNNYFVLKRNIFHRSMNIQNDNYKIINEC